MDKFRRGLHFYACAKTGLLNQNSFILEADWEKLCCP
jgi:hypothetical protein